MQQLLQEYLGNNTWIPYDYVKRKDTFKETFEKLDKYSVGKYGGRL